MQTCFMNARDGRTSHATDQAVECKQQQKSRGVIDDVLGVFIDDCWLFASGNKLLHENYMVRGGIEFIASAWLCTYFIFS